MPTDCEGANRGRCRIPAATTAILLTILHAGGCGGELAEPEPPDPCTAARAIRPSPSFLGVAAESDLVARVIPGGFAGMYHRAVDDHFAGDLIVRLQDVSKAPQAGRALRALLACGAAFPGWSAELVNAELIEAQAARFTATELYAALQALAPLRSDPDVWGIEFDPEANRVWIGIANATARPRVEAAVARAGVALDKVMVEAPPAVSGGESFAVVEEPVLTGAEAGASRGVMFFSLSVAYTNRQATVRYPDWCVAGPANAPHRFFLHRLERWEGGTWRVAYVPICVLVLLAPRPVEPGQVVIDSVPVPAVRRLGAAPIWSMPRITGTYRLVGQVYQTRTATPPLVADLAPLEEQVSAPFRLRHTLPF